MGGCMSGQKRQSSRQSLANEDEVDRIISRASQQQQKDEAAQGNGSSPNGSSSKDSAGATGTLSGGNTPSRWSRARESGSKIMTESKRFFQPPRSISRSHLGIFTNGNKLPSTTVSRISVARNIHDYYNMKGQVLGTGMNGDVKLTQRLSDKKKFALKEISTKHINSKRRDMLMNEIKNSLALDHPNICRMYEVFESDQAIFLIMELCHGKELYDRLSDLKRYSEKEAAEATHNMLKAIHYIHSSNICHRDLKLENWMYSTKKGDLLKLIDFGFSKQYSEDVPMTAVQGTVYYVSPEVMEGSYNNLCDIWSIGVIVYMLLSGSPPFAGDNDADILAKIKKGVFTMEGRRWANVSQDAKDFISHLLVPASKRPDAEKALTHPWLKKRKNLNAEKTQLDDSVLSDIKKFSEQSAFKRAVLGVISHRMEAKEIQHLNDQFNVMDKQGNGTILFSEFKDAMRKSNLPEDEIERIFNAMDQREDHQIHYSEFIAAAMGNKIQLTDRDIQDVFERFDVDNSGYISKSNLHTIFGDDYQGMSVDDLMQDVSKDKDKITFEDFRNALMNRCRENVSSGNINDLQKLDVMTESMRSANFDEIQKLIEAKKQQQEQQRAERTTAKNLVANQLSNVMESQSKEDLCVEDVVLSPQSKSRKANN